MRLAVTGASGFIGGAVCRAAVAEGWQVFAFGRRATVDGGHVGGAAYRGWDISHGALPDPPAVDAVLHAGGSATDSGARERIWAANVTGTRHVLDSFPDARIVHVSSASVYDPYRPTVRAREAEAPVRRYLNAYGASKAAAEEVVREAVAAGRRALVLRPRAVYGPGDTTILPRLLANVRRGRLVATGDGRPLMSVTSIDNLVRACLLAASGPVDGGVYNITDSGTVTVDQALRGLLASAGVDARPWYLPTRLVWPVAGALEAVQRWRGGQGTIRLNRYLVSQFAVERTLDIDAARDRLGFRPAPVALPGV